MGFGKFGARPRSVSNPLYWVGRYRQDERIRIKREASVTKFNEKWNRLNSIKTFIAEDFIQKLNGHDVTERENIKLNELWSSVLENQLYIAENINTCSSSDLSKYATSLKQLALHAIKLCKKLNLCDDIITCEYIAADKSIFINGNLLYDLG